MQKKLNLKEFRITGIKIKNYQEPMTRSRKLTFTTIYINLHNLHTLLLLFLSLFHNNFILIGHSKQCVQSRRTRGVLKIERYEQRLTHRACMGEASSYSWAPEIIYILKCVNYKQFQPHIF